MEELLIPFGYAVLFLGCLIKGEAVVIAAVFASERGYFDLPLVLTIALIATLSSDHLFYFLGRKKSRDVLWKHPHLIPFAEDLYERLKQNPLRVFMSHQFLNGFTQKIPYITGTSNLKPISFIWYNLVASFIWLLTLSAVALLLNSVLAGVFGDVEYYELGLLTGILVTGLLIQLTIHVRQERLSVK